MNACTECVGVRKVLFKVRNTKMGNLPNELLRQSNSRWKKKLRIFGVFLLGANH